MAQWTHQVPEDLITEILVCMPVKSVLRFSCLSKSFHSTISTPGFVNWHLRRCSENMNRLKVVSWRSQEMVQRARRQLFHVCDINNHQGVEQEIVLENTDHESIFGHCNGLLLLYLDFFSELALALWNPSTGKYQSLPDLRTPFYDFRMNGLGLGYDESTNDYKVVFMMSPNIWRHDEFPTQVWIFRVRSNIWTRIQDFPSYFPPAQSLYYKSGYFADGALHWSSCQAADILVFDLRKETFTLFPLPPQSQVIEGRITQLHVLRECLCVSFSSCYTGHADLYIKRKNKDNIIGWEHLCSLQEPVPTSHSYRGNFTVLGYLKSTNKILLHYYEGNLLSYDLQDKSFRKVEIDQHPNFEPHFSFLCTESLVWI